jgi:hypothetical protein
MKAPKRDRTPLRALHRQFQATPECHDALLNIKTNYGGNLVLVKRKVNLGNESKSY